MDKYDELENVSMEWFLQARSQPTPILLDRPKLTEKALEIAKKFKIDGFKPVHNGIRYRQISGEAESLDKSSVETRLKDIRYLLYSRNLLQRTFPTQMNWAFSLN